MKNNDDGLERQEVVEVMRNNQILAINITEGYIYPNIPSN